MKRYLALLFLCASPAQAGVSFATGIMAMNNSTRQGGQGTEGGTLLTETNLTYHGNWWAVGAFFQYDKQGKAQIDTASGPRLELSWNPFYIEYAYAIQMNRSFTDRSIAEQEGKSGTLGLGVRFPLGSGTSAPDGIKGAFLQFTYKMRTQTVSKQDGKTLDEPIVQKDGYPLFGIGFGF